jgi:DnaJ-domain-containing protein 1
MTDYFSVLNEPRRPWLDPDALKEKFLSVSTTVHPDRVHHLGESERATAQERSVELNAAYSVLREPKNRLRHLLTLELGTVPTDIQRIPQELMDSFMEVGQLCKRADKLVLEKANVTSPLLKVQLFERSQQETEELLNLQQRLAAKRHLLVESLKQIDKEWSTADSRSPARVEQLQRLEELHRLFSYFDRWIGQVQERIARLSF